MSGVDSVWEDMEGFYRVRMDRANRSRIQIP